MNVEYVIHTAKNLEFIEIVSNSVFKMYYGTNTYYKTMKMPRYPFFCCHLVVNFAGFLHAKSLHGALRAALHGKKHIMHGSIPIWVQGVMVSYFRIN